MNHCSSTDCPAPAIDYEQQYRLPDGKLVCPFCFSKENKPENKVFFRETKKIVSQGYHRIPSVNRQQTEEVSGVTKGWISEMSPKSSDELRKWKALEDYFSRSLGGIQYSFDRLRIVHRKRYTRILESSRGSLILAIGENASMVTIAASRLLSAFNMLWEPRMTLLTNNLPAEFKNSIDISSLGPIGDNFLNIYVTTAPVIPLTEMVSFDANLERLPGIKEEIVRFLYLGWLLGKEDILESLLIFKEAQPEITKILLIGAESSARCFDSEIEKRLFRSFPLYLPSLLDDTTGIFRQQRENILRRSKTEEVRSTMIHFLEAKGCEKKEYLEDFLSWPSIKL